MCLDCDTSGSESWVLNSFGTNQYWSCDTNPVPDETTVRASGKYSNVSSNCPIGTMMSSGSCINCFSGCATCTSALKSGCSSCLRDSATRKPKYLDGSGNCVLCDTETHYYDPALGTCTEISTNCSANNCSAGCDSMMKCKECDTGFSWTLGICYKEISGKFISYRTPVTPSYVDCHADCAECFNERSDSCKSCSDPSLFYNWMIYRCVPTCTEHSQYYQN